MTKLFYIPGACSFGPHMALREASIPFSLQRVSFVDERSGEPIAVLNRAAREKGYRAVYGDNRPFREISRKALVPALLRDDGMLLTEGSAIYQFIAQAAPRKSLAPPEGSREYYVFLSWLSEIASRVHKAIHVISHYGLSGDIREQWKAGLIECLDRAADLIRRTGYILGEFSLVDLYAFMNWHVAVDVVIGDFSRWLDIADYFDRISARPAVSEAIVTEGTQARYFRSIVGVGR
ncbi:hypothetical protein [Novosphingobium sp.]|uniref:hypothetical protein n=1 Tax=Novosphingobium sp. TaxID=1874826 RepID=UPI0028A78211|nr:hypothetical protein [Novosphingobium sp.]